MEGLRHPPRQTQGVSAHESEDKKREARAERILDAASILIQRYGYHRTSIDDIAKAAEVGKGTLYLHWKTREDLFIALILREKLAMAEDIKQRAASDPAGATLYGLVKHAALALMQRPLLKAVLLRDTEIFGKLAYGEQSGALSAEVLAGFTTYLQELREHGLLRTDLTFQVQAAILSLVFVGFFLAVPHLPEPFKPTDEDLAEMLAETVHSTLEARETLSPDMLETASSSLMQYMNHAMTLAQEQLHPGGQTRASGDDPSTRTKTRRKGGRSKKLKTAAMIAEARRMYADKSIPIEEICSALGISRASLYRYVRDEREEESS